MGFVLRAAKPLEAAGCSIRAARHDGRWVASAKTILGGLVRPAGR
jgi:hypothetical protein